jgi:hypothetical protein
MKSKDYLACRVIFPQDKWLRPKAITYSCNTCIASAILTAMNNGLLIKGVYWYPNYRNCSQLPIQWIKSH